MLMAHNIFRDLTDEMRDSFYATICDEYTDISNKEQLTLCVCVLCVLGPRHRF